MKQDSEDAKVWIMQKLIDPKSKPVLTKPILYSESHVLYLNL